MKGFPPIKVRVFSFALLSVGLGLGLVMAGQRQAQSQSKSTKAPDSPVATSALSASEKDLLNEINDVRAHPEKYITYLEGLRPFFKDKEYHNGQMAVQTQEGWSAVYDAITFLRTAPPQPPFSLSEGLRLAATSHVKEQSASGTTGHKGASSSLIEDRVKPFGQWTGGIGESLSYGNESARDRILTWLIDDGFASRGHRKRLLSPDYKVAGVSCGPHPEFGTMCAITLAGGFTDTLAPAKGTTASKPVKTKRPPAKKQTTTPKSK